MTLSFFEIHRRENLDQVRPADHKQIIFPGGEAHVSISERLFFTQVAYLQGTDANDIMKLAMWADAWQRHETKVKTILVMPYLPAARMDRGVPFGAKVYADMINAMDIDRIICIDPHSDVAPALYDRLTSVRLDELPLWSRAPWLEPYVGVIAPDAGAHKRAEAVAGKMGVPVYQASKKRDFATGKLSGFGCEPLPEEGKFLLVDDICDGGGTFLGLANALDVGRDRLGLWVTHGIFSGAALNRLSLKFSDIYTTDSHPGYNQPGVTATVYLLEYLLNRVNGFPCHLQLDSSSATAL